MIRVAGAALDLAHKPLLDLFLLIDLVFEDLMILCISDKLRVLHSQLITQLVYFLLVLESEGSTVGTIK